MNTNNTVGSPIFMSTVRATCLCGKEVSISTLDAIIETLKVAYPKLDQDDTPKIAFEKGVMAGNNKALEDLHIKVHGRS